MIEGIKVSSSPLILEGTQVLWNKGAVVVVVPIGAPIEDAECDHIQMHPADLQRLLDALPRS